MFQLVGVLGHILVNFRQKLTILGSTDRGVCFGDSGVVTFGILSGLGVDRCCFILGVGIDLRVWAEAAIITHTVTVQFGTF